jgi:2-(1,2-epoxy-1,2-dihydrophenyl)acetyl-CoA isomerase
VADLEISTQDGVMVATLNRPDKKNATSKEMLEALRAALAQANDDPAIRCFVLTGAGDAFCSGGDLGRRAKEAGDPTPLERKNQLAYTQRLALAIQEFEKPLIAAVNGPAIGAGMDMSLMCDIRFAAASARFSEGYIKVGLIPGNGGCWLLPRLVGTSRALELLWTGDHVSAEEAQRIGLVNRVFPDDQLIPETLAFGRRLAEGPPLQQRDIKKLLYQGLQTDFRTSLEAVTTHMAVVQSTSDYREAIQAFKEKRKAKFSGS